MDKLVPHYPLRLVLMQMNCIEAMNPTATAHSDIRAMGMNLDNALSVIRNLTGKHFYKSMTTHADHRIWQDVYHAQWCGIQLYIKIQKHDEYFVVSFKER